MITMRKLTLATLTAAAAVTLLSSPANAQRDPAYAAARANGTVGEQTDGYLGVVGQATPALRDMVNDINIKRRAVYTQRAQTNQATLEAYATTAGCQAIARTVPGEKYQGPDGAWKTRTSAPPERLSICP